MTLRERIADWISGGALSRWATEAIIARLTKWDTDAAFHAILAEAASDPSRPSVKRIARIAREALE